ncbi:hypothetical protein BOTBODRAFT_106669 [Botryobasidium botryosum FD-172 SS1]|uniref:Uncharacterized protein n=1 Tax=Botryobasidium botryosum (strain FD-172 SS1) TaxID=930990 RepID=A0A067MZ11_BOTB1|nr:hypothetical protein BOTBODRAFT_106669 [Botryobasidium botryosum FD-172 SS1]
MSSPKQIELQDDGWLRWAQNEECFYPLPFAGDINGTHDPGDELQGEADLPRTVIELKMNSLSSALRDKPSWIQKSQNPSIIAKWREEILMQQEGLPEENQLTHSMVDYVLAELAGYAKLFDKATGIEMGCCERVWKSDSLISTGLCDTLLKCVARLEDVPDGKKDWHPNSNNQVLDLVHPSLYPLVYGRTRVYEKDGAGNLLPTKHPQLLEHQWGMADFDTDVSGKATLASPYINNLDRRKHGMLYKVIEHLIGAAVPMWNRVLSDLRRPLTPPRVETSLIRLTYADSFVLEYIGVPCIWGGGRESLHPCPLEGDYDDNEYDAWLRTQPKRLLQGLAKYDGALDMIKQTIDLSNSRIQVIVKFANIVLTPDKPDYPGGPWHVEGMKNESIVSTFTYYYDEENITESHLAFRTAIRDPIYHDQDDRVCMDIYYMDQLGNDMAFIQHRGYIVTKGGRCIAFPNIYEHQVQPFDLVDKNKPGHQKIVTLFLIDPTRKIISTTDVPPQHREDYCNLLMRAPTVQRLPPELHLLICKQVKEGFTREEAEEFRLDWMKRGLMARDGLDE